jgi:hypothetical protein
MRVTLATSAGTPGWPNEDFAATAPGAAVLLDGATTWPPGTKTGCIHGVAWYARALGSALLAAVIADPPEPLAQALASAIGEVRARHEHTCDLTNPSTPAATVTIVRAGAGGLDYLALSDSSIAADYGDGREPVIITDDHRPAKADPAAALAARTGTIATAGLHGVALLSDGATRITDRYGVQPWAVTIGVIRDRGPAELIGQVRAVEDSDPEGARWPRGKLRDDATVIYWQHS